MPGCSAAEGGPGRAVETNKATVNPIAATIPTVNTWRYVPVLRFPTRSHKLPRSERPSTRQDRRDRGSECAEIISSIILRHGPHFTRIIAFGLPSKPILYGLIVGRGSFKAHAAGRFLSHVLSSSSFVGFNPPCTGCFIQHLSLGSCTSEPIYFRPQYLITVFLIICVCVRTV